MLNLYLFSALDIRIVRETVRFQRARGRRSERRVDGVTSREASQV